MQFFRNEEDSKKPWNACRFGIVLPNKRNIFGVIARKPIKTGEEIIMKYGTTMYGVLGPL